MYQFVFLAVLISTFKITWAGDIPGRKLKAVHLPASVTRRSIEFVPSFSTAEVVYLEDKSPYDSAPLGARVSFTPDLPLVLLDNVDNRLKRISCHGSKVVVDFHSLDDKEEAYSNWSNHSKFLVLTSVSECAEDGAHQMFIISAMAHSGVALELTAEKTTMRERSKNLRVQFGNEIYDDLVGGQRYGLKRRSQSPTRLPYPYPTDTHGNAPTEISKNIAQSIKNTNIIPPSGELRSLISKTLIPKGVILSCVECSTTGSLELSNGDFGFDMGTDTGLTGHVDFIARGVKAHVELELKLLPGFLAVQYVAQLPPIPIPDLGLAGTGGAIGAYLVMEILMGVELDSTIEFFGGFELEIPDGSQIHIDVGNPGKSFDHGFPNAKLKALPFNMHSSPPKFKFYAGLQPHIQVGVQTSNTSEFEAAIGVGVFLDAPRMQMSIGEVDHVNEKCEPTKHDPVDHSLIHVVPQVILDSGVDAVADVGDIHLETVTILTKTSYPLPTACLDFDSSSKNLAPAGQPKAKAKTGAAIRSIGGARGLRELITGAAIVAILGLTAGWL